MSDETAETGIDALAKYEEIINANLPEVATPEIVVPEFPHFTVSNPAQAVALAVREIQGGATGYAFRKQLAILAAVKKWRLAQR
jgi:hypothetical protein